MNAGKDGDLVANPDVIVDDDWSLLLEALGHHGDVAATARVVARDDGDVLTHHHVATDVARAIDLSVDADARVVAERHARREHRVGLDVHRLSALLEHEAATEPTQVRLSQAKQAVRGWQMLCQRVVQRGPDLTAYAPGIH